MAIISVDREGKGTAIGRLGKLEKQKRSHGSGVTFSGSSSFESTRAGG